MLQGRRKSWKSGGCQYYLVGLICPPPSWDRVNWFAKIWGAMAPPAPPETTGQKWILILNFALWAISVLKIYFGPNRQTRQKTEMTMTGKTRYNAPPLAFLLLDYFGVGDCGTGLFWGGRFYCWTFLLWEIVVLDYFEVGDSATGLFWSGRFWCWTF